VIEARPLSSAPTSPDTRERLLRSAIQVFAEHGYAGGTIRDICRRAQANLASVHYYTSYRHRLSFMKSIT
jgi:AcrR family transcriptional regulator